jgi:hypothetical protein
MTMRTIPFILSALLAACSGEAASGPARTDAKTAPARTVESPATAGSPMKLKIRVNDTTFTATLEENSSAKALVEFLRQGDLTLDMEDYGGFEKVADLPRSLPRNDRRIDTDAGDLILYLGKRIVIYYDRNSWDFTRLGKIDNVNKIRLKQILGEGDATATFSVE